MLTRGWLALLPLAVGGHNWMHEPRSRSGGSSTRLKARPTVRDPHVQVGPNQTFVLTWTTGHGGSYIFVVVHKDDEDKLPLHKAKGHGGVAVQEYVDEAPPEAYIYNDTAWKRWFVSCSYLYAYNTYAPGKNVTLPGQERSPDDYPGEGATYNGKMNCEGCSRCGAGYYPNDGTISHYERVLSADDPQYYEWPDAWSAGNGERGLTQIKYHDWVTDADTRLSYYNPKYPWIEAVHHFGCNGARPREWDAARFSIPGRKGSGEYMVHMVWGGYKDVIDVDLLPSEAADKYGRAATATTWAKTDHCQYVEHGPPSARGWPGTCFPITDAYDDGDSPLTTWGNDARYTRAKYDVTACMEMVALQYGQAQGLNVVPLRNPALVADALRDSVNLPELTHRDSDCDLEKFAEYYPEAYARNDTLVCYWVTEADSSNAEVDSPWTVVDDDPEDPVFYSTCYQKQSSWEFVGNPACPACEKPQVGSTRWKYGERCVSCAAAEHYAYISSYNLTVAPWWEFTDDCENCDRR